MNARPSLSGSRWSQRTPDESFDTIDALRAHVHDRRARAEVHRVPLAALRPVEAAHGVDLSLDGAPLRPTAWAARRYSAEVGLPAQAVQALSPRLATMALAERRAVTHATDPDREVEVVIEHRADRPSLLRSLVSRGYARTWDADLVDALLVPLAARGWQPARANAPGGERAALFASDRDLFCFLVHEDAPLELDEVHPRPLRRGLLLRNSEVPGTALRVQTFWFDSWCTNHMIFGAREVLDLREVHRSGDGGPLARLLEQWADWGGFARLDAPPVQAAEIARAAAATPLVPLRGPTEDVVEDAIERTRSLARRARATTALRVPLLRAGARLALERYRRPGAEALTLWSMAGGLTEAAQQRTTYTDDRHRIDAAVGRVLELAYRRAVA